MEIKNYLRRIGLDKAKIEPTLKHLKLLQRQHLLTISFENLDIYWQRSITLDVNNFYQKVIENKRGGFCYELNGLFYELLNKLGFKCKMISARVNNGKGGFGEEYDHLVILVEVEGREFLTDVGFGDFIAEPIQFILEIEQEDSNGTFSIRKFDNEYFEVVKKDENNEWQSEYIFKDLERDLSEFSGMCSFHQSSESHFSKGAVCSLMTENGRKTLTDKKFIQNVNGNKNEIEVNSDKQFLDILEKEFGIKK